MKKRILSSTPVSYLFKISTLIGVLLLFKANFVSGQLISNVVASTGHPYAVSALNAGAVIYTDRTYQTTAIPAYLNNAPFIKTPNDDKATTSSFSFTLSQDAMVYIGYDPAATALPAWLNSWQRLQEVMNITDPRITHFDLFNKFFPAGKVTIGGNKASPAAGVFNMLIVMAVATNTTKVPPTVNITSPLNNATIKGTSIKLNASAADIDGLVSKVDFYYGATLLGSDPSNPYSFTLNNVAPGNYTFNAQATDNDNQATMSLPVSVTMVANIPPAITIITPANDTAYKKAPASVKINASVVDEDGTIAKVDFYNGTKLLNSDKTSPYSFTWNNVATGKYTITAKATDNDGASTTSLPKSVSVAIKTPPTVSITKPGTDTTYTPAPATIVLNAVAADLDGTISKVVFYRGTTVIGTDNTFPYTVNWNAPAVGKYSITAKATDNDAKVTTSLPVSITVASSTSTAPPTVTMVKPTADTIYTTAPASVKLYAIATAYNSTIKTVDFYDGLTFIHTETTAPYEYTMLNVPAGTYVITAKATDMNGFTSTSLPVTIAVRPHPSVISVTPANNATNVNRDASISTSILSLPNGGTDNNTIISSNVFLTENATGALVPSNVNGTGGGDAITLVPVNTLKMNTVYKFNITAGVKDLTGTTFVPFTSTFTTNSTSIGLLPIQFEKVPLPTTVGRHTSVTMGPDGKLYALVDDGLIKRFTVNGNGTLSAPELLYSLQDSYGTRQKTLAIGLTFDPSSTANNLIVWVSHCNAYKFTNAPDWDGRLTKLSGNNLQNVQKVLINLPRSAKDHVTNSIAFGPDGALYYTQGSTSAMGQADQTWNFRNEHLLNAAVLRLDLSKLGALPLDAKTIDGGGTYDPYALNAPLTIYATGIRNSYDLAWHSNGTLYVATNGSAAGGNTPASVAGTRRPDGSPYNGPAIPALSNIQQTQEDFLYRIVKGGYYGHPNPTRGEYVMNGGNPTSAKDNAEVVAYPLGTLPDANWRGSIYNFKNNISPNGFIEYKSNTFNGALKGKMLFTRYSAHDDILTLTLGTNNTIIESVEGTSIPGFTGFIDPLDLTEDVRNGNIYVSEYGGDSGKITLLRPTFSSGQTSLRAARSNNATAVSSTSARPINTISGCDDGIEVVIADDRNIPLLNILKPKISPNPIQKKFNIQFPTSYQGEYTLQIADISGRVYQIGNINLKGGTNMGVDISKLSLKAGTYFLKLLSENKKSEVFKLIIARN